MYYENKTETVLINSNFNCGYFINREKLFNIIKTKYNINSSYDACSYPGIQCQFYYNKELSSQNGKKTDDNDIKVSFMIFRTGSVLIVGKCSENILNDIYIFVKNMLEQEYKNIYIANASGLSDDSEINKEKKNRKQTIIISPYLSKNIFKFYFIYIIFIKHDIIFYFIIINSLFCY